MIFRCDQCVFKKLHAFFSWYLYSCMLLLKTGSPVTTFIFCTCKLSGSKKTAAAALILSVSPKEDGGLPTCRSFLALLSCSSLFVLICLHANSTTDKAINRRTLL